MDITNIDDLLAGGKTDTQPATPEHQYDEEENESLHSEYEQEDEIEPSESHEQDSEEAADSDDSETQSHEDDYGNKKDDLSKNMQKRLDKIEKKHAAEIAQLQRQLEEAGASKQMKQAAQDAADKFEFDPNSEVEFEEQFAAMVRKTLIKEEQVRAQELRQKEEYQEMQNFKGRFEKGMNRFDDFVEVVENQPIDDAMTLALRGVSDPAAFIYAASKRMPQELERISKLKSPHDRYAEMIRLETKLKATKTGSKTPKPIGRIADDAHIPDSPRKKSEESIEDLIAKSESKKLAMLKARRGK